MTAALFDADELFPRRRGGARADRCYTGHPEADELLFKWGRVIAWAQGWERGFALSIQRDRKRHGWTPSYKQLAIMHRLVAAMERDAPCHHEELPDGGLIEGE